MTVSADIEVLHLIIRKRSIHLYPGVLIQTNLQENLQAEFRKGNIFGIFIKVRQ